MKLRKINPEFVEFIPKQLDQGVLYISLKYRTATHMCCCGCGTKIVTPLTPTDWQLTEKDGRVSLWPSVGNWNHSCQSHYIINKNMIRWVRTMSAWEIARGREHDTAAKEAYYGLNNREARSASPKLNHAGWRRFLKKLLNRFRP